MAERRMMAKSVIETDAFMDMPMSTQCFYFHLLLRADDDGFIKNPSAIRREIGASVDDYKLLVAKQYILPFESGVIVIKHWKIHNYIQKDRYHPTDCKEMESIEQDGGKAYKYKDEPVPDATCIQNVSETDTPCIQSVSIGKDRLGKNIDDDDDARTRVANTVPTSTYDEELGAVIKSYLDNIQPDASSIVIEKLTALHDTYGAPWCSKAIEIAAEHGGRSVSYIKAVLEERKRSGTWERSTNGPNGSKLRSNGAGHAQFSRKELEDTDWSKETSGWDGI